MRIAKGDTTPSSTTTTMTTTLMPEAKGTHRDAEQEKLRKAEVVLQDAAAAMENPRSVERENCPQNHQQERTELGQYLRDFPIVYSDRCLFPLTDGLKRIPNVHEKIIKLLLWEIELSRLPDEEGQKTRTDLERELTEAEKQGGLFTEVRNLDEIIPPDITQYYTAFKQKYKSPPSLDDILIYSLFKNKFNREATDDERAALKQELQTLGWDDYFILDNFVNDLVKSKQRKILGDDAKEGDIEEGLRLGGLATREQVEASREATKILTEYHTSPPSTPNVTYRKSIVHARTYLQSIDEVNAWIYLRDVIRLNMQAISHLERIYIPAVIELMQRGTPLPENLEKLDEAIKTMQEEDRKRDKAANQITSSKSRRGRK